ncbi:CDP-diacylglycerol pyrophosphatase [Gordonia terrae]|uniref:CDP-diacylglycerol diphosphatase n=2 Tax=Gordoniaceae TaxID=85026 RepID=A0A2I1R2J8_9ACTN|nr:CDP-diacylglycerol pyrophosphatase [Gordonia terrae]
MTDTHSHRFTRLLSTMAVTAAIVASTALSGGGVASAAPPTPGPTQQKCGQSTDDPNKDVRLYLWGKVRDTNPGQIGDNLDVVQPGPKYQPNPKHPKSYAIRNGGDHKGHDDDFLLLPTNRIKGIECPYLYGKTELNLWSTAWLQAGKYVAKNPIKPIAIGVNSAERRGQDQLHIHLAQVHPDTLADLKAITNPQTHLGSWTKNDVVLRVNPLKSAVPRHFRVVKYTGGLPNLFRVLNGQLPAGETMEQQSIAVVDAGQPNTYFVLNSNPKLGGAGTGLMDIIYGWGA